MDDTEGELKAMRGAVQELVYQVDEAYTSSHKHNLFDRKKTEQHPFLPHVTLGRISYNQDLVLICETSI